MKLLFSTLMVLCVCFSATAQEAPDLTDKQIADLKFEIEKEAIILRKKLSAEEYDSEFIRKISIDFQVDTFKVERLLTKKMEVSSTNLSMVETLTDAEYEYDKLLNKYYGVLINKLSTADKELLKQTQRSWILFRDSERKLSGALSKEEYSGGGTVQNMIYAEEVLQITRKRVIELYNHISRIIM